MFITKTQSKAPLWKPALSVLQAREVFRFIVSMLASYRHQTRLEDDLNRLAKTSPHLLEDIGFVEDEIESNQARKVLKLGTLKLELFLSE